MSVDMINPLYNVFALGTSDDIIYSYDWATGGLVLRLNITLISKFHGLLWLYLTRQDKTMEIFMAISDKFVINIMIIL